MHPLQPFGNVLLCMQGWGEAESATLQSPLPHRMYRSVAILQEAALPCVQA